MKKLLPLLFAFLMFMQPVSAFNALEKLDQDHVYLYITIKGRNNITHATPPMNPFNDPSIMRLFIIELHNETHLKVVIYSGTGSMSEKIEKITEYYPTTMEDTPFKLSEWNLSKILKEYQWGVENYLPNVTGKRWPRGYWNSMIAWWKLVMNATHLKVTLHAPCAGECDEYITFECWRNGTNVTCKWDKPVLESHPGPPINGTIPGMDTGTTSTTSRTTTSSSTQTTTSTKKEKTVCGPALIVGLALIPVLVRGRR